MPYSDRYENILETRAVKPLVIELKAVKYVSILFLLKIWRIQVDV